MPLTDVTQPAAHITQTVAVLVGAGWAYMKYVRGRTFRYRAELEVEARALDFRGDPALLVLATMRNEGLSRIRFSDSRQKIVYVDALDEAAWLPDANIGWGDDPPRMQTRLFAHHDWIEPGEEIREQLLIPVPSRPGFQPIAYQVRGWVRAPRRRRDLGQAWTANAIVPVRFEERSPKEEQHGHRAGMG